MAIYKVEVDRGEEGVLTIDCKGDLEKAKEIAGNYNAFYGYDTYIKEITCIYIRRTNE